MHRSHLSAILLVAALATSMAAADHHNDVPLGTRLPGDQVTAEADPPGTVLSGSVINDGGWPWTQQVPSLVKFTATVPGSQSGAHSATFAGTYTLGGSESGGADLQWDMVATATGIGIASETLAEAPDGTPNTRTTVGTLEEIGVKLLGGTVAATWTADQGTLDSNEGQEVTWKAPVNPGSAVVTATVDGHQLSITFTVVKPSFAYTKQASGSPLVPIGPGFIGAAMTMTVTAQPTSVNFYNCIWHEQAATGVVAGYFSLPYFAGLINHPVGPVSLIRAGDNTVLLQDNAGFRVASPPIAGQPPLASGTLTWEIPVNYDDKDLLAATHLANSVVQLKILSATFSCRVVKDGVSEP